MRALQEHQNRGPRRKSSQGQLEEDLLELDAVEVELELGEEECPRLSEWPLSVALVPLLVTVLPLALDRLVLVVEELELVELQEEEEEESPLLLEWLPSRNPLEHQLEFLRTTHHHHLLLHHLLPHLDLLLLREGLDLERPLPWPL